MRNERCCRCSHFCCVLCSTSRDTRPRSLEREQLRAIESYVSENPVSLQCLTRSPAGEEDQLRIQSRAAVKQRRGMGEDGDIKLDEE